MCNGQRPGKARGLRVGSLLLGACLGVCMLAAPVIAQEDPAKEKISIDLRDANLRDAIDLIFKDTSLNHVVAQGVYGTGVTLRLDNIEREQALRILLESRGLEYNVVDGVYMIKPKEAAQVVGPGAGAGAQPGPGPGAGAPRAGVGPGTAASSTNAVAGELISIPLRHLDPWYAAALLQGQSMSGGSMGMGGGSEGGFGGSSFGSGGFGSSRTTNTRSSNFGSSGFRR